MNRNLICKLLLCLAFCLTACVSEEELIPTGKGGYLQLSMANISTATTRVTPDVIGKPLAKDFRLRITNTSGRAVYDDVFTEKELTLPTGRYDVTVTYGHNDPIAIDAPYYIGTENVEIKENETTEASITAKVGNALVSAVFGRDADEQARFERYYSDWALLVYVDNNYMRINKTAATNSIYVQAGSHVTLRFWGKLRMEDDREVSCDLESSDFPNVLNAADHAIVTLSLPDPESALGVDIAKVEIEAVTLDETIPLSWLPVPTVMPVHQFDASGNLVGTNLTFSDSYPGMNWKVEVSRKDDATILRTVQGTGALVSAYSDSKDWPYLPAGAATLGNPAEGENIYTATYYIVSADGSAKRSSSRDFRIPVLQGLVVTVGGYTSYDKYLEGNIEAANACERLTIYEPSVTVNIASSLLHNNNYSYSFTYTYDGTEHSVEAGYNYYKQKKLEGQPVRSTAYVLRGDATFDGVSATAQRNLRITGLPYSLNLASHEEWTESGGVDWYENDVRLGHLSTGSQYIQTTSAVCIPPATCFCADYSVNIHTLTIGTYLSIKVGDMEVFRKDEEGTPFRDTDHQYSGTTEVFSDDSSYATTIRCYNDYGAGQTCSHIYSLTLKYAAKP